MPDADGLMTDEELAAFYEDEYYGAAPFPADITDEEITIKNFGISDWEFDFRGVDNPDLQKVLRPILEAAAAAGICEVLRGLEVEIDWFGIRLSSTSGDFGFHRAFRWQDILAEDSGRYAPGMMPSPTISSVLRQRIGSSLNNSENSNSQRTKESNTSQTPQMRINEIKDLRPFTQWSYRP